MIVDLTSGQRVEGPATTVDLASPQVPQGPVAAIHFESFADGRGYSIARQLRRAGYAGTLRATGDNGLDQLFYLFRCGFDQAEISEADFDLLKPIHLRPFDGVLQPAERSL